MTLEARITQYCDDLTFAAINPAALEMASRCLLDCLGVALAGARDEGVKVLAGVVEQWGGEPQSRVLGRRRALPAPAAAMLNGAAARVLDFDDVADPLGTHPSVAILPSLLAIADLSEKPVDRQAFLTAFVAGQDLSIRLSRARKETLLESGRYDLCKVIAATAAAGKLYGLRGDRLHHALGIAYTSALGETQCMIDGASTVFYQQGLVAANAVRAVVLAANGFTGASQFLTGRWGYYNAFEPGSAVETIDEELGITFSNTDGVAFKPYPTCRPNTSAVALALELVKGRRLNADDVVRIDVLTNQQIYDLVSHPVERKQAPTTVVEARFSLAYTIATALSTGDLFINDFTEHAILRPSVIALGRKIFPAHDDACEIAELGTHGRIKIRIELTNGEVLQGEVDHAKGNWRNPMTNEDLLAKFNKCVAYADAPHAQGHRATIVDWIFDRDAINPSYEVLSKALHA